MEAFVLKLINIVRFSLVALIVLSVATTPLKISAQETEEGDEDTFVPPPPTASNPNPPVILDESDSGGVSDVEEYDN